MFSQVVVRFLNHTDCPLAWNSSVGRFYEDPNLGFYYYCNNLSAKAADMWLVESFQHGGPGTFR